MEQMESLSSILGDTPFSKGEPAPAEPAPPAAEPKAEAPKADIVEPKTEPTRDESGRFAPKTEVKTEEKAPITKADVAAIIDERRKRQELERELSQLRQQNPKPKTDVFENPDLAISERVSDQLSPLRNQIFELQLQLAKTQMPDFDDAVMAFLKAAESDPVLKHAADTAPNELQFIYREGLRLKELGDVGGDIRKYREKVTAEATAKLSEKDQEIQTLKSQLEALTKAHSELSAVPRSLNQIQAGSAPKVTDADPEDINQLVRFKSG
jgi:DNA repair exonuclease SbcCD ATPase subunit